MVVSEIRVAAVGLPIRGRVLIDQVQNLLGPVQDAHAHSADLLRIVRVGVAGDVVPAEVVCWSPLEPGESGCDELSYLGILPFPFLSFRRSIALYRPFTVLR